MPAKVIKFRHKETGLVWEVDQPAQMERMDASKDFERVADAPVPAPADKAAADKAAEEAARAGNS